MRAVTWDLYRVMLMPVACTCCTQPTSSLHATRHEPSMQLFKLQKQPSEPRMQQQDENRDPSKRPAAAGAGALPYALDLCSGCWTQLPTAGGLSFDHLESLVAVGGRLVAVGWQTPRAGRKDDTPMQVKPGSSLLRGSPSLNVEDSLQGVVHGACCQQ